uniref:Uncharacterized protein n=1 Tax=Arundo donax TaxID=35708 RepID=A0A0A9BE87_ARUDO
MVFHSSFSWAHLQKRYAVSSPNPMLTTC